jgi:hypothetical protein
MLKMGKIVNPAVQGANDSQALMNLHRGPFLQSRLSAQLVLTGCLMIIEWFVGLIYTTKFFNVKRTPAAAKKPVPPVRVIATANTVGGFSKTVTIW